MNEAEATGGAGEKVSRWYRIDQDRIDAFAGVTEDDQYIHTDPARAAQTPFGGTIAHGFLTLSMLSAMSYDIIPLDETGHGVNYGFDRIRFIAPVPSGARIRGRFVLAELDQSETHGTRIYDVTIEVEGEEKPALAARWITRQYP